MNKCENCPLLWQAGGISFIHNHSNEGCYLYDNINKAKFASYFRRMS